LSDIDYQNPEILLVAGALIKPALAAEAARYVSPEDFDDRRLGKIWGVVVSMVDEGVGETGIDPISVSRRFGTATEVQRRIATFCGELLDVPMSKSLVTLAQRIRRRSTMRVVRTEIEKLHEELDDQIDSADGDIPNLDERLANLSIGVTTKLDTTQRRTIHKQYIKEISDYLDDVASFDSTKYIPTGIPKLDGKLGGGLRPGQLHAILGSTGSGKTALASQLCDSAVAHGHRAILFSMEVDPFDIYLRDVERIAGRSRWDLKSPTYKEEAFKALFSAQTTLANKAAGKIVYAEPVSVETIRQVVLTERMRGGPIRMIAVDHAQVALPSAKERQSMPRYLVVKGVAEGLRALARHLNVAVVLTAQLNPPPKDVEPSMDQVRESKDINNTAEVVMLIHHKREDHDGESLIVESYIRVEKIRAGIAGKVKIKYHGEVFRFEELYSAQEISAADSVG
jgi:replicative DNA helicase